MKIETTAIPDLKIIHPDIYSDNRGLFFESYNIKKYKELGINVDFVQDNQSVSQKNVIRGLHFQIGRFAQDKLVRVIYGKVLDVAVDIRFGSPTFGKYVSVILTDDNFKQFFIPKGFAHGFSVLSEKAIFLYKCSAYYSKPDERGIIFNDKDLKIDWQIDKPIVSAKDLLLPSFKDIEKYFIYKGE